MFIENKIVKNYDILYKSDYIQNDVNHNKCCTYDLENKISIINKELKYLDTNYNSLNTIIKETFNELNKEIKLMKIELMKQNTREQLLVNEIEILKDKNKEKEVIISNINIELKSINSKFDLQNKDVINVENTINNKYEITNDNINKNNILVSKISDKMNTMNKNNLELNEYIKEINKEILVLNNSIIDIKKEYNNSIGLIYTIINNNINDNSMIKTDLKNIERSIISDLNNKTDSFNIKYNNIELLLKSSNNKYEQNSKEMSLIINNKFKDISNIIDIKYKELLSFINNLNTKYLLNNRYQCFELYQQDLSKLDKTNYISYIDNFNLENNDIIVVCYNNGIISIYNYSYNVILNSLDVNNINNFENDKFYVASAKYYIHKNNCILILIGCDTTINIVTYKIDLYSNYNEVFFQYDNIKTYFGLFCESSIINKVLFINEYLVAISIDNILYIVDINRGVVVNDISFIKYTITDIILTKLYNKSCLIICSKDNYIRFFDIIIDNNNNISHNITFKENKNKTIKYATGIRNINNSNSISENMLKNSLDIISYAITISIFDTNKLAIGENTGNLTIFNLDTSDIIFNIKLHFKPILLIKNINDKYIISISNDNTIKIINWKANIYSNIFYHNKLNDVNVLLLNNKENIKESLIILAIGYNKLSKNNETNVYKEIL